MHDDIRRPGQSTRSAGTIKTVSASSPLSTAMIGVDEAKIAAEFGPTPDTASAALNSTPEAHSAIEPAAMVPAASEDAAAESFLLPDSAAPASPAPTPKTAPPAKTIKSAKHGQRRMILLVSSIIVLLVAGSVSYAVLRWYTPVRKHISAIIHQKPKPVVPVTVPSTLTGLLVNPDINNRPVTAVMIENSIDARPQSGLDQAGVVFEAIAEGGVTRFMALFQDTTSDYIGPVRSARPYYIQWLLGFDAAYAHVGGSPDALSDINAWNVKDMNEFYNAGAYQRISSRYAPHNVYTSSDQLGALESQKGFNKSVYSGFTHKKEAPSKTPNAISIDIKFSGFYYDSHYDYDAATNTYKRSESGAPHLELHKDGTQVQIAPKVVVAMVVPEKNGALDSSGAYYADYASIGSGQIQVFQDGVVTVGTWSKDSNTAPLIFKDANGQPLALNAGQAWIAATPLATDISYK